MYSTLHTSFIQTFMQCVVSQTQYILPHLISKIGRKLKSIGTYSILLFYERIMSREHNIKKHSDIIHYFHAFILENNAFNTFFCNKMDRDE